MKRTLRRGFTLTDLAVVLVCLTFLGTAVLQNGNAARERANRVKCQSNLSQIGKGLLLYSVENKGAYPRGQANPRDPNLLPNSAGPLWPNRSERNGDAFKVPANDVSVAIFILLKQGDFNSDVFVCPSSAQTKDTFEGQALATRIGFTGPDNLSYSFSNPYPCTESIRRGYKWSGNVQNAEFAIAADRNDGSTSAAGVDSSSPMQQQRQLNSGNHDREGQNVLYSDGHCEWQPTSWVGTDRDCIYAPAVVRPPGGGEGYRQMNPAKLTFLAGELGVMQPTMDLDSVMVPWAGGGFPTAPAMAPFGGGGNNTLLIIIGGVGVLAGLGLLAWLMFRKKARTPLAPIPAPAVTGAPGPAVQWFRMENSQPAGPFSLAQLNDMAHRGQLLPSDPVWHAGSPNWVAANTVPGVFSPG